MGRKIAMFVFNGEPLCFVHVMLNALDLHEKGHDVKVIMEGSATGLIRELADPDAPFAGLFSKMKSEGLIECACKACANKMGSAADAKEQQIELCAEMSGHPAMSRYMKKGYEILTF